MDPFAFTSLALDLNIAQEGSAGCFETSGEGQQAIQSGDLAEPG